MNDPKQLQYLKNRWKTLCGNVTDDDNKLDELDRIREVVFHYYSDPLRFYHGLEHIYYLLKGQEEYFPDASIEVQFAIWFHDIFYVPGYKSFDTNVEFVSSDIARTLLSKYLTQVEIDIITGCIDSTYDHQPAEGFDYDHIMIDLDLMGLGGPPDKYDANTAKIRKEFAAFTDEQWREGRIKFLTERLERATVSPIFQTSIMYGLFENKAIRNMTRELEDLQRNS